MHPLNALAAILLLFPVQDQLHKHLLQLLIAVVDAGTAQSWRRERDRERERERDRERERERGGEGGQVKEIG